MREVSRRLFGVFLLRGDREIHQVGKSSYRATHNIRNRPARLSNRPLLSSRRFQIHADRHVRCALSPGRSLPPKLPTSTCYAAPSHSVHGSSVVYLVFCIYFAFHPGILRDFMKRKASDTPSCLGNKRLISLQDSLQASTTILQSET